MPAKGWVWLSLLLTATLPAGSSAPPKAQSPIVVGLPAGFDAKAPAAPYDGPHPSRLQRPAETFRFPIRLGEVGPSEALFAGPRQYPFVCDTEASGLGQPLVDNHARVGTPVVSKAATVFANPAPIGYSQDCLARTRAWYYYKPRDKEKFERWSEAVRDVDSVSINGTQVPFIVRVEMGTINRFIYVITSLKGPHETLAAPSAAHWNGRLIYQFSGGVGIGHRQGRVKPSRVLEGRREQLAQGYAVVASTGTTTSTHYNIWLAEDTALRVKRQFVALYGEPDYTIGVGGSGGAIQQYLLAQNRPGLIDAAIAQYSYPDMVTQTIWALDCELLEYYFDRTDHRNPLWHQAEHRQWVEGLNASNDYQGEGRARAITTTTRLALLAGERRLADAEGQTECVVGWRGLTPLVLNPRFASIEDRLARRVFRRVQWSYFEDLKGFYGTDAHGYARIPWDNVGVQYGLRALQRGQIDAEQFLRLNARVGSWKPVAEMERERFWILRGASSDLQDFSPWSAHNMNRGKTRDAPAPRFEGDRLAMAAAYRSGQVFLGRLDIPVIDVRHYLEPVLDMHHASASFSVRARLLAAQGDAGNQAIWVSDRKHDPTPEAFAAIERWLAAKRARPEQSWSALRPAAASDRCIDAQGKTMFSGDRVWDGEWNQRPPGPCMRAYPIYGNTRIVAGDTIRGDHFKCALQTVGEALDAWLYEPVDMRPYRARLERIFPQGVCDYRQADQGRPADLPGADGTG